MDEPTFPAAIGVVALTVSDLSRSLAFYQDRMGLTLISQESGSARLGAGETAFLALTEVKGSRKPPRTTGLYHYAVLVPNRWELANALRRMAETQAPIQGAADHGVSEAVYLADPDGTGIEIYTDRAPRDWPQTEEGAVDMGTEELNIDGLMDELERDPREWSGMAAGTRVGHVHLHVSNLPRSEFFYTNVLGLKLMQRYGSAAAFLSYGGYHHHVGINTWAGAGAPPPPEGSAGLRYFELRLPQAEIEATADRAKSAGYATEERENGVFIQDPSQNGILLVRE